MNPKQSAGHEPFYLHGIVTLKLGVKEPEAGCMAQALLIAWHCEAKALGIDKFKAACIWHEPFCLHGIVKLKPWAPMNSKQRAFGTSSSICVHLCSLSWIRYAKFEMQNGKVGLARQCYERAVEELGEDAQTCYECAVEELGEDAQTMSVGEVLANKKCELNFHEMLPDSSKGPCACAQSVNGYSAANRKRKRALHLMLPESSKGLSACHFLHTA
eukprot:1157757-Pelagomonas_calceolata.AAC.13